MVELILVRYGEISLKGKNRADFENQLIRNIKKALPSSDVEKTSGRLIIRLSTNQKNAIESLKKIFGIVSVSKAVETDLDMGKISSECLVQANAKEFSTFRVSCQRMQKRIKPSPDIEREIGASIVKETGKKVKLKSPDLEIFIEIAEKAYIFTEKIQCLGGLPVGIEGRVSLLVEDTDSAIAGILMMKRGCDLIPFSLSRKTKTTDRLFNLLEEYGCHNEIRFAKSISEIEEISEKNRSFSLVLNQTLGNFKEIKTNMVLLRPLIGISPEDAKSILGIK